MRVSFPVYLNLENEEEKLIYDYLQNKNKNSVTKRAILEEIKNAGFSPKENYDDLEIEEGTFIQ